MVREFTELQGTMGGIYTREEGQPEAVWKAIYYHYLPIGVEADAAPSKAQLGGAAVTWAAVSLADKIDTVVGLFAAGEKPTGSRDPYGLRRAAQAATKILTDLQATTGLTRAVSIASLVDKAFEGYAGALTPQGEGWRALVFEFFAERQAYLLERRGFRFDEIRAAFPADPAALRPYDLLRRVQALSQARKTAGFEALAVLFKRVKNITKDFTPGPATPVGFDALRAALKEPAEQALLAELEQRWPRIEQQLKDEKFLDAMTQLAHLHAPVDTFFVDVLVMADDPALREARLALLTTLRDTILMTGGDISEIAPDEPR
ncbi:MAG: glycine--tRNA ligase subunit beta [Vicinamibacterales bacterium]